MTDRSPFVLARARDCVPSQRLRDLDDGYRVAAEILVGVADLGVSGDVYDFVASIMEREAHRYEREQAT